MTNETQLSLPEQFSPTENCLKDKIIMVTGAGDGIGRIAAKTYAAFGATVILLGRTTPKLEMVYDEIEQAGNPQPAIYPINFEGAVEKDYIDMCNTLEREFGRIDGILFNASELGQRTPIQSYDADTWSRVLQVNLTANFLMTKTLLPLLEHAPSASVIFTSSSVGHKGRGFWGAYAVSKAGVENLCEVLADEWDGVNQVRINTLNPGATRTNMRAAAYPAENPASVAPPEQHMPLYVYLMSNDSVDVNGQHFKAQ
ncbi:YciK family oxidoreductase [Marinibactrum halimedae]|uniref:Short-chain dehydrogenase n=1 Tax=Marinibactrum halimedae TaxID=1444977 RepID=A0AA37WQB8_9GAMM|nr:YciK family oxidoreductase [Marinibactrum halimedae]MCD9459815.1 YciK family oxidoreductase [Marinibactrum halimedae]GLS26992.1 short-chain dehydrogenase [Marinibactrum halimedae]